jgi:hypothetical protein
VSALQTGTVNLCFGPTFPLTVSIGSASITLNADGSATGDVAALGTALAAVQGPPDASSITGWLILHCLYTLVT